VTWRWGHPLSRAEADALARRWAEGDIISEPERYRRLHAWIQDQFGQYLKAHTYDTLREARAYMADHGLREYTADVDPVLVAQTVCEELCAAEVVARDLHGNDLDGAYWSCMHQCAPVTYPETLDMSDPRYPHSTTHEEDFTTTFSLPPRKP